MYTIQSGSRLFAITFTADEALDWFIYWLCHGEYVHIYYGGKKCGQY